MPMTMEPQQTTNATWGTAMRRRSSKLNRLECLQRQSSKTRLFAALGLTKEETVRPFSADDQPQHAESETRPAGPAFGRSNTHDGISPSPSSESLTAAPSTTTGAPSRPTMNRRISRRERNRASAAASAAVKSGPTQEEEEEGRGKNSAGPAFGRASTHEGIVLRPSNNKENGAPSVSTMSPPSSCGGSPSKSSANSIVQTARSMMLPKRNSTFSGLLRTKLPALDLASSSSPEEIVVLPEQSLISGKGRPNMLRRASERSLVKKISRSIHQEMSAHGSAPGSQHTAYEGENSTSFFLTSQQQYSTASFQDSFSSGGFDWNEVEQEVNAEENQDWKEKVRVDTINPNVKPVPPILRKELDLGGLLGQGAFSKVVAVKGIKLMQQDEYHFKKQKLSSMLPPQSPEDEMAHMAAEVEGRQELAQRQPALVVKHLNRKLLQKPKIFQQAAMDMAREAQLLAAVDCDYIIKIRAMSLGGTASLDSGRFNDFFLVLDRLQDTLDARIVRWKEEQAHITSKADFFGRVTGYALELASALEYLHDRRVVFRDTKPQNVGFLALGSSSEEEEEGKMAPNERVQLFDFGLCRSLPQEAEAAYAPEEADDDASIGMDQVAGGTSSDSDAIFHMSIAGTQRYMSPEMQLQEAYNCKTDVYSWAMTYYEMLSTRKPYGEILRSSLFQEYICELGKRPFMGDMALPDSIQELLKDSWCHSVRDRLSMKQVKERLEGILADMKP